MNDTTKEYNGKNTDTNVVWDTLWLRRSWNLVTFQWNLVFQSGEVQGAERGEK